MARFQADFSTYPTVIYAPAKVSFTNRSTVGLPINDDFTITVDENGNIVDLSNVLDITQVSIGGISKYEWTFDDGDISVERDPEHVYDFPNVYQVRLSIYSDEIYEENTGIFFRVKNTVTKSVDVGSMSVAWLRQHMTAPHSEAFDESQGFQDLITASSKMFDRMYQDLTEALTLIDIEKVAPKFLEFFSDTLGHKRFYAEKVGYRDQLENDFTDGFLDYDIFDRISRGVAGQSEIQLFRQFIEDTALLFKQNGSETAMESFFKLYGLVIDIKEMWTTNFGTEPLPCVTDNFFNDPTLQDTLNGFRFIDISVSGLDNSKAHLDSNLSNLIIDNYHYVSKHVYPADALETTDPCRVEFEINEYAPYVLKTIRDDGRKLADKLPCADFSVVDDCLTENFICTTDGLEFTKNADWAGITNVQPGVNIKFWRSQDNYVQSVQNVIGPLPKNPDESDELPSDTTDDYLWADWRSGVTVAPGIPGTSQSFLRKPTYQSVLPNLNLSSTNESADLISGEGINFDSSRDLFVDARGFIKVDMAGYYNFTLDIGNTGTDSTENHLALFSLKHYTNYSRDEINEIDSLDNLNFSRIPGDLTHDVTNDGSTLTVYGKASEYGTIEIRTDEALDTKYDFVNQDGGFYYLEPGYYAYDLKATYNTLKSKKLKLMWEIWNEVTRPTGTFFEKVQDRFVIPPSSLLTINEEDISIENTSGKGILSIPVTSLEGGDSIKVVYANSHSDKNSVSGIVSTKQEVKDAEFVVRIAPCDLNNADTRVNLLQPSKKFGIFFRATNEGNDLYATVDTYYAFILNGKTGKYGLAHVTYNSESDSVFYRYLNLNPDDTALDQRLFFKYLTDELEHIIELEENVYYDFKVTIKDDKVSVYFRENSEFTTAVQTVQKDIAINLTNYNPSVDEWKLLLENIDIRQEDAQTETFDLNDASAEVPVKYVPSLKAGQYGIFVVNSIFKINKFTVNPTDNIDILFETNEKWKKKKPRYMDSRNNELLQYNSYGVVGDDQPTSPTFKYTLTNNYNQESSFLLPSYLGQITDNSINRIYADSININDWGTRFNIVLDADYVSTNFKTTEQLIDSLRVPLGNFLEPYIDWERVQFRPNEEVNPYLSMPQAGYSPLISDISKVSPHTIAATATEGKTLTEFISFLTRDDDNNTLLSLEGALNVYMLATGVSNFNLFGAWEEVAPHSSEEEFEVDGLGTVSNEVFDIIYNEEIPLGVRVKNEQIYEKLQCRYCEGEIIWGLYDIELPEYATNLYPPFLQTMTGFDFDDLNIGELNILELVCDLTSGYENIPFEDQCDPSQIRISKIRYFLPIGKLDGQNYNFLPPAALFENELANAELLGVYSHIGMDKITQTQTSSNVTFVLDSLNEFEKQYKSKVKCNYYLDLEASFTTQVTRWNETVVRVNEPAPCNPGRFLYRDANDTESCGNFVANALIMPDPIVKVLQYLEEQYPVEDNNVLDPQYAAEYTWWSPNDLWFKRKVETLFPENSNNQLFTGYTDVGGTFYGQTITEAGINITLEDDYFATPGEHLVDAEWCVSSVGWDPEYFNVPGVSGEGVNPSIIEVGATMRAPIPFQTIDTSSSNVSMFRFGSYYDDETLGKRTFSPVGVFNWFQTHSDGISGNSRENWDIIDWNNEFARCVNFKGVYGRVQPEMFEVNKYWSFYDESIPPVGTEVIASFFTRNCYGTDGENTPPAVETEIVLGVSDGILSFYTVPPIVEDYPLWRRQINGTRANNFTLEEDEYFITQNISDPNNSISQINFRTDMFNFIRFEGSKLVAGIFFDKVFNLTSSKTLEDDFASNRTINWVTYVDNGNYYELAEREIDAELKYTSESLPYNITTYRNNNVYQASDKFVLDADETVSGNTSLKHGQNIVGIGNNSGFQPVMALVDVESNNYSFSTDVIFDRTIFDSDYNRNFELIVKAENNYIINTDEWGISDFYFVGIGAFGFDVALGMRSINQETGEVEETFLASFGEFNVRSIDADTWYSLRVDVATDNIKVFFNERYENEQLILNYNINKKYEKLTERYLKGEYETLQAILVGLEELTITYPEDLNSKVSDQYTFENFKEEFAGTLPINGQYTGFRIYNPLTYVTNVSYVANLPKEYKFGSTFDGVGFNELLYKIQKTFGLPENPDIRKIDSTLRGTIFVQINDRLFFQEIDSTPDVYSEAIDTFKIVDDKIIIVEKILPGDGAIGMNEFEVGENSFVWSLVQGQNIYNVTTYSALLQTIPNASKVSVTKTTVSGTIDREVGYVAGTSGTISGSNTVISPGDEVTVTIAGDRTITWPLNGELARFDRFVRAFQEGFDLEYPILIKDRTFYKDSLANYLDIADKNIKEVIINDNTLHLIFEDN